MTIAQSIARNIVQFAKQSFSDEAKQLASQALIDTLGVMYAGSQQEEVAILRAVIEPTAKSGASRVFGWQTPLNALDAALLNGMASHILDFDDANYILHGHISTMVIPTLLAAADDLAASDEQILSAYITGFETAIRFGLAVSPYQYTHGWHPTTTVGLFAAVASAAVIYKLNQKQTATALSIATTLAAGIKSNFGSMTKSLGAAQANRNALLAVQLAKNGFSAGKTAFEHHHGYFNVFNGDKQNYTTQALTENWLANPPAILDPSRKNNVKRFPCCYAILGTLDGVLALQKQYPFTAEQIKSIIVEVHPIRYPHIHVPDPKTPLEAKFSLYYCVAKTLLTQTLTLQDFIDEAQFSQPNVHALMKKITLKTVESENTRFANVTIIDNNGQRYQQFVSSALGSTIDNPFPPAILKEKFINNVTPVLGKKAAQALYKQYSVHHFAK